MCNEGRDSMSSQLIRLIWELRSVEFSEKLVATVLRKIKAQMWCTLPNVDGHIDTDPLQAELSALSADASAAVNRKVKLG